MEVISIAAVTSSHGSKEGYLEEPELHHSSQLSTTGRIDGMSDKSNQGLTLGSFNCDNQYICLLLQNIVCLLITSNHNEMIEM